MSENLRVLNCAFYFPKERKNPLAEHINSRIPGAQHYDLGYMVTKGGPNPYMLPDVANFTEYMKKLRIRKQDTVICYDYKGIVSSPRVWWTLKYFGFENVKVLNGGFVKWSSLKLPTESGEDSELLPPFGVKVPDDSFKENKKMNIEFGSIRQLEVLKDKALALDQIIDARPAGQFEGKEEGPVKANKKGHIRHAINIAPSHFFNADKITFKNPKELYFMFTSYGLDLSKPTIAYCMTGITACTALLALVEAGAEIPKLYNGSWLEYVIFVLLKIFSKSNNNNRNLSRN